MRVELLPLVEPDLDVIWEFIGRHNPTRALSFVEEIRSEFQCIGQNPLIYPLRNDLGRDIRMAPVGSYIIFFRVNQDVVEIRRVVHGARNLKNLLI